MALDIQTQPEQPALDGILRQHLRLEPPSDHNSGDGEDGPEQQAEGVTVELQKRKTSHKGTVSQPPMKFATQTSRLSVNRSTIEADNKRRPGILKRNASRYESPSPEPADPNSEAKSVTINRMQNNLQEWEKQLKNILEKKSKNDEVCSSELSSRDQKLKELENNYSTERKLKAKAEKQKDKLTEKLRDTEEYLLDNKQQVELLQNELAQYELAYQEMEFQKNELERETTLTAEQLQNSEGMRRRLNDQVTELQGQLAIEEQRSKFCTIL